MKTILQENKAFISGTWDRIGEKIVKTASRIQDGFPHTTHNGVYDDWHDDLSWWTNSFWAGILWQLYKDDKSKEIYKTYAQNIEKKLDEVLHGYDGLHHDVGFMWLLTSVLNHELTGDSGARQRAMLAANVLSARYNFAGGFIRAWNGKGTEGLAIIDCMMNIPLLFWASEQSEDDRFKHIGIQHANKTIKDFIREDGSVNHIVTFNTDTGEFVDNPAGQGYASGSSWSRGQSWAIYGFAQTYTWTGKSEYLHAAKRIAHYVLSCLPLTGYVPLCDYRQPAASNLLDSSAGAITACGLIDIAKSVPEAEKSLYLQSALLILKALDEKCAIWDDSDECILTDATAAFHRGNNPRTAVENGALIYGDYYFVEAIAKLKQLLEA